MPKWVYRPGHPKASTHGFVAVEELGDWRPPAEAKNAPILAGRFYEGARSPIDGADIGTRARHRRYMKEQGLAMYSDYGPDWGDRVRAERARNSRKHLREVLERKMYQIDKP